ncbi:MAG: triosephosphate isomerase [Actinobacteria bacterium]|nr:triosephosphate isomerase [Actinomycetota bacterium]
MKNFRKMVIFANWKIFMRSRDKVADYVQKFKENLCSFDTSVLEIHIMADILSFEFTAKQFYKTDIKVGVQDLFYEDSGAYAGAVSPLMLKDLGCDSAYLGHSESKIYFGETDENVNKKVHACLRNNIIPMMFVGETREELESGRTEEVLKMQLSTGLKGISTDMLQKVILIYEPRWAIGQKESAPVETIRTMQRKTRYLLAQLYSSESIVSGIRILYGGSVSLKTIGRIIEIEEVDGIGAARAAMNPFDFIKMARITEEEAKRRLG